MPDSRQLAEEGEVEDGEVPVANNASSSNGHGSGGQYRSSSASANNVNKRPSIQIGLAKSVPDRSAHRPSLFDEDAASSRTNRITDGPSGLSIKGAAVTGPGTATTTVPSTNTSSNHGHGLYIKGRSNGDSRHGELSMAQNPPSDKDPLTGSSASYHHAPSASSRASLPKQMNIKGSHVPVGLPPKPGGAIAMPFKMKGTSAKPASTSSTSPFSSSVPHQAPSNAIGKGYGNVMIAPKIPSIAEPGPSYTPPPRQSQNSQPRPASPRQRPPSPPSEVRPPSPSPPPPPLPAPPSSLPRRPPTPQDWSNAKGKAKEQESEEGEELEEGEEPVDADAPPLANEERHTPMSRSSPHRINDSYSSAKTTEKYERYDNDDRRKASFGRSQGDRWEPSYRSPRSSRYHDRHHQTSSRHHRDHDEDKRSRQRDDNAYYRKTGYDSYEDEASYSRRDRDSDRDRRDGRERSGREYDEDRGRRRHDRHDDRRYDQSGNSKGNVWRRGSSYSPNDQDSRPRKKDADFHDEPGAPRHFDREIASARKSLPSTPSLPLKPGAGLPERPGSRRKEPPVVIPPLPQVATPFFLPTPPGSTAEKTVSPWDDEAEGTVELAMAETSSQATLEKVQARSYTLFGASPLGQYILEEKLGEGTFGVVHKARRKDSSVSVMPPVEHDRRFKKAMKRRLRLGKSAEDDESTGASRVQEGDVVALKKIVMHNDMDGVPITALREIRILKTLRHPNVVPVVDMAYQSGMFLSPNLRL